MLTSAGLGSGRRHSEWQRKACYRAGRACPPPLERVKYAEDLAFAYVLAWAVLLAR